MANLEDLKHLVLNFRDQRNWAPFHTPKDLAISISVEAAELLETFQWRNDIELSNSDIENISHEIADIFQYLILLSDRVGIDISSAVREKIKINETRFPVSESYGRSKKIEG